MSKEKNPDEIKNFNVEQVIGEIKQIVNKASRNQFRVETDGILQSGANRLLTLKIKYQERVIASFKIVSSTREGEQLNTDWIAGVEQIPGDLAATIKHSFEEIFPVKAT